jgi:hypothetical protein
MDKALLDLGDDVQSQHKKLKEITDRMNQLLLEFEKCHSLFTHAKNEYNQYQISVLGMNLVGDLGNIYDNRDMRLKSVHQVSVCKYGNKCGHVLRNRYCKFYHAPCDLHDLLIAKKITREYYDKTIKLKRNFVNTSWLYSPNSNKDVRHIGSAEKLPTELIMLQNTNQLEYEYKELEARIVHDLLVLKQMDIVRNKPI